MMSVPLPTIFTKDGPSQSGTHSDSVMGAVAPFQPGPRRRKKKVRSDGENLVPELAGGGGLDVLKRDTSDEPRDGDGRWAAIGADGTETMLGPSTHMQRKVAVENMKPGMFVRPAWNKSMPFREVTGRSKHDDSHPSDVSPEEADDPLDVTRMFVPDYGKTFGPHVPEGTIFHALIPMVKSLFVKFDDTEPRDAAGKWTASDAAQAIHNVLRDSDRSPKYQGSPNPMTGQCYVASESAYHLLGGKKAGWKPMFINHEGQPHWFLRNERLDQNLDITESQFKTEVPHHLATGKGFLTKEPSARSQAVIDRVKSTRDPSFLLDPRVQLRNFQLPSPQIQSIADRFKRTGVYDRSEMPQLSGYPYRGMPGDALPHDPKTGKVDIAKEFRDYLTRHKVKVADERVPAGSLRPTQNEIDAPKVAEMTRRHLRQGLDNVQPMWISKDNYVLDGHHRWATYLAEEGVKGGPVEIPVIRVDLPMQILFAEANRFADRMGIARQDVQKALGMGEVRKAYDPSEERDTNGEWTTTVTAGTKLYHATSPDYVDAIRSGGLHASANGESGPGVYTAADKGYANKLLYSGRTQLTLTAKRDLKLLNRDHPDGEKLFRSLQRDDTSGAMDPTGLVARLQAAGFDGVTHTSPSEPAPEVVIHNPSDLQVEKTGLDPAAAVSEGLKSGGFTINTRDGSSPTTGYVVAVQGHSSIIPCTDPTDPATRKAIEDGMFRFLRDNHDLFANNPAIHLGGWHDTEHGEFVLDPSEVVPDEATARKMGSDRNQQAIWDIANQTEIETGGTGDREADSSGAPPSGEERRGATDMDKSVRRSSAGRRPLNPSLLPVGLPDVTGLTRPVAARRSNPGPRSSAAACPPSLPVVKFNANHGTDGRFTSAGASGGGSRPTSRFDVVDPSTHDAPWTNPPPMTPEQKNGKGRRRILSGLHVPQYGNEEHATDHSRTLKPGTTTHPRTHYPKGPFAKLSFIKVWDESKHPRGEPGNAGEFGPGGGGGSAAASSTSPSGPTSDPSMSSSSPGPIHQPVTPSTALADLPDHLSPHLSATRTLPPLKGQTESREVDNPDNPTATTFSTLPPEFQKKILDQVYKESPNHLTPEMMDANLEDVFQHAQSDPEAMAAKDWYDAANGVADGIAAENNIHLNAAVGMIAAMSPQTDWDSNQAMARFSAQKLTDDAPVQLSDEEIEYRHKQSKASKGDAHDVLIPNGARLSEMTPGQAAWALYAMASDEGLTNGLTTAKGVAKRAQLSMGAQNVAKAVRIFRGESPDAILSGHKVRSFYNNIQDPDDTQGHGDVTVDTHAVSAATGYRVTASGRTIKKMFEGSASTAANVKGAYALFADAYRRLAQRHGITPNQAQAMVWVHWQTVKGGHVGYRESHPEIPNDVPPKSEKVKAKERETKARAAARSAPVTAG